MRRGGLVAVLALAAVAVRAQAVPARVSAPAAAPLVVYGYPYAGRCPDDGVEDVVDRWGMYACNCTSYVAWALVANRQRIDWFVPGAMNAWNWPHVARLAGLRVDRTPAPGAVAVWPAVSRPFGHVAYVIRVHRGGSIDVAEYNYPLLGADTFAFDVRTFVSPAGAVFIHVPRVGRRSSSPRPSRLR